MERLINKLKAWRGIATRYDKTPDSYLAGLHPARLDDLDQRPHTDHPLITTRYAP
ncbi:transposase IS4 family protein [Streptomyces sp. FR-008]|nr:transposase IS4 family protein [Streptomyces sp. FR-008]